MVVRFSLIFLLAFSLLACKEEVEHKGSEIPPETVLNTPVQWERQILYLNSRFNLIGSFFNSSLS